MKTPRSLKARALQLLAQREQSRVELRRKLLAHATSLDDADADEATTRVDALLDWLESHRFLSAERFVESRVQARSARFGNLRIRQELKQHGLALDPEALVALAESELERAHGACARKFPDAPADVAERARLGRFLIGRGFSPEIVRRVMREMDERSAGRGAAEETGLTAETPTAG